MVAVAAVAVAPVAAMEAYMAAAVRETAVVYAVAVMLEAVIAVVGMAEDGAVE